MPTIRPQCWIGVDPGWSGGIATIYAEEGRIRVEAVKMPATEADIWTIFASYYPASIRCDAIIEKVHSMPKQGVSSTFKFGHNYGFLRGMLVAASIPFREVTPQAWQKWAGARGSGKSQTKTEHKNKLKQLAQQRFPELRSSITLATADALLIAAYCRATSE